MEHIKRIDRKLVYEGSILKIYEDTMQVEDGRIVKWDFIGHQGAAAVVPVRNDGKILMVRQYRNSLDRMTLEIPAGCRDYPEEPTIHCAYRELQEETGYQAEKMEFLIRVCSAIAFCDEMVDVYVASGLTPGQQHLDPEEAINVEAYTIDELADMIYAGSINDSKTVAALMAYKNKYSSGLPSALS